MSDYLPFELQSLVIKKLPVKPLLQFRSVSKRWKALIDSSEFINAYSVAQIQMPRLLVWYEDAYVSPGKSGKKIVSFVDDETLKSIRYKSHKTEIDPTALGLTKQYKGLGVVGGSKGLLCLYHRPSVFSKTAMAVLWNPSIRKSVRFVVPRLVGWGYKYTVLGFGVCPITSDPTIVKITNADELEMKNMASIEVFTLSTGSWTVATSKLPDKPVTVTWNPVTTDKFIYWFGYHGVIDFDFGSCANKLIISFDLTNQEISVIDLPDCFARQSSTEFSISKLRDSLVVLEYNTNDDKEACVIWMMNYDVPNVFTKLFTVNSPYASIRILGFMKSGGPIMATQDKDGYGDPAALVFYEPRSQDFKHTAISAKFDSFFVESYMETLLLLDQPDSIGSSITN